MGIVLRVVLAVPRIQGCLKSTQDVNVNFNFARYLAFLSAVLYLPILNHSMSALACTYLPTEGDAASAASGALAMAEHPHVIVAETIVCWRGTHYLYGLMAFLVLVCRVFIYIFFWLRCWRTLSTPLSPVSIGV